MIREAINRLVSCNLVERKANIGARVVALTPDGLAELYQVRESLEGMAARLSAKICRRKKLTILIICLIVILKR